MLTALRDATIRNQCREEAIIILIASLQEIGLNNEAIIQKVAEKYNIPAEDVKERYMQK